MSALAPLMYAPLLCLVTAVQLEGFYFHHEESWMGRERGLEEGWGDNGGERGFSTSSDQIPPFQEINLSMR